MDDEKRLKKEKTKIKKEQKRLMELYSEIEEKRKIAALGLIERAAFLKVKLEFLEDDLNEHGFVEMFSQGNQEPYERQRPNANLYTAFNGSYQKCIKQLTDLLPKESEKPKELSDGFESFVSERDDA